MLDRGNQTRMITGKRLAFPHWKLVWCIVLFLCVSVIAGCGATPSSMIVIRQQPQPTEVAQPFHATVKTFDGDFTLTLTITPNRSGTNVFTVRVMDNHTDRLATRANITLYTTMQDMPMGTDAIILHADGKGQFSATSDNLSMAGHWAIGITIQTSDHSLHKAGVSLVTSL
jgi:copper transport protein